MDCDDAVIDAGSLNSPNMLLKLYSRPDYAPGAAHVALIVLGAHRACIHACMRGGLTGANPSLQRGLR